MTIAATSPVKIYAFTGAGDYIFDFLIFKDTNVKCYHTDATTGAVTALTYSTDYTVDFTEGTPGGTVTVSWNTETDGTLEIRRALPFTQEVDWVNNNALDMGILEAAFDRATMLLQQMDAIIAEGSAETVWKGNWTTGTAYSVRDLVVDISNNYLYVCAVTHTASAAIATDIASGYWKLILEPTSTNVSDDAFGATWDGLTNTAASKNALYDELNAKANQATTYTETEVNNLLNAKASLQATELTVTVGAGGDYPTINAALEYLSKLQPVYPSYPTPSYPSGLQPVYDFAGITATINLLTGFVMPEQVLVRGLDLGWITITGADAETTIANTALTTNFTAADYDFDSYPAFGVSKGGVLPRIDQLFRFDVANVGGYKHGIMAIGAGSSADVLNGCGVKDAGTHGILANYGSTINANGADASGAGTHGIFAISGSTINARSVDASGSGSYGIRAYSGSIINADNTTSSSYSPAAANTITADGIIFY